MYRKKDTAKNGKLYFTARMYVSTPWYLTHRCEKLLLLVCETRCLFPEIRWHFAYNCILEEQVKRRRQMWSWQFISQHRKTCKLYKETYKKKLSSKKVGADVAKTLEVRFPFDLRESYQKNDLAQQGAHKNVTRMFSMLSGV